MQAHPEGGWFVELFRSDRTVAPDDDRSERAALTTILFLLDTGYHSGISALHRVRSDEVWHHLAGDPIELVVSPDLESIERIALDPEYHVFVVPADHWQSARTTGNYTLVGCTVGPGFDFVDFELLRDLPNEQSALSHRHPDLTNLI